MLEALLSELRRHPAWRHTLETVAVRPGRAAQRAAAVPDLSPSLRRALAETGVGALYTHQALALALVREGRHTVLATGTASGKSLCFHLPALAAAEAGGSALLVYPTKALARDQLLSLGRLARSAGLPPPAVLDGDTGPAARRQAVGAPILVTNPDYLHCRLLPCHRTLASFWRRLRLVVLDEIHVYEGLLGHRVAGVMERLVRICRHHGSRPTFVTATATSGRPEAHASALIGSPCRAVEEDGSPRGRTLFLLARIGGDPLRRRWQLMAATADVLSRAVAHGIRTLAFAPSRRETELILALAGNRLAGKGLAHLLVAYRAGYLPETRRLVEEGVARGSFRGVVATSALELGVDLGPFRLCLLCGLPGSPAALRQRLGRVGRRGQTAAALLLAGEEEAALARSWLTAAALAPQGGAAADLPDPFHPAVVADHLLAAAAELPLSAADLPAAARLEAERLVGQGLLRATPAGLVARRPVRLPPLRGETGPPLQVTLLAGGGQRDLATVTAPRLATEVPEGGVHLHLGQPYPVQRRSAGGGNGGAGSPPHAPTVLLPAAGPAPAPAGAAGAGGPAWPAFTAAAREILVASGSPGGDSDARQRLTGVTGTAGRAATARLELVVGAGQVHARRAGASLTYLDASGRRTGWRTSVGPPRSEALPALWLEFRWDPAPPLPALALQSALQELALRLIPAAAWVAGLPGAGWRTVVQSPCPWTGVHRLILLCPGGFHVPFLLLRQRARLARRLDLARPPGPCPCAACSLQDAAVALLAERTDRQEPPHRREG